MMEFCPICGSREKLNKVKITEEIKIRGESFPVETQGYSCGKCQEEFFDLDSEDIFAIALQQYRRKHEYLRPAEMKGIRKKYGLTQQELSSLLGWGGATLSRYENGTLQTEGHEKTLRLISNDPSVLLEYIRQAPGSLSPEKREKIITLIKEQIEDSCPIEKVYEERFGNYRPDEYSGFTELNLEKLYNAILLFCKRGQFQTKLNKLVFYSDFSHFKKQSTSITGLRYVHLPYGPVPDKYSYYIANMEEIGLIELEEVNFGEYGGQVYRSTKEPNLSCFSRSEIDQLEEVIARFNTITCSAISELSHDEDAWRETSNKELISYEYAKTLKNL